MLSLLPLLHALPMLTVAGLAQVDSRLSASMGTWLRQTAHLVADGYRRAFPVELFGTPQSRTVPVIWTARSAARQPHPPARRSTTHRFRTARVYMAAGGNRRTRVVG